MEASMRRHTARCALFRRSLYALLLLASLLTTGTAAAATLTSYRLERTDGTWTRDISLDSVHAGRLYITDGGRPDSIAAVDVASIRRERTSYLLGGLVGFVGGSLVGAGLGAGIEKLAGPSDHGNWSPLLFGLAAFCASVIVGTAWGASEGVTVYPRDDLSLEGMSDEQRSAALARFVLDERLRAAEP
jgi:hypothetical protein